MASEHKRAVFSVFPPCDRDRDRAASMVLMGPNLGAKSPSPGYSLFFFFLISVSTTLAINSRHKLTARLCLSLQPIFSTAGPL